MLVGVTASNLGKDTCFGVRIDPLAHESGRTAVS